MMGFGIEPVIDRKAELGSEALVMSNDGRPAAIGEDRVVFRDELPEGIGYVAFHAGEGSRCVDVPEQNAVLLRAAVQDAFFQEGVIRSHAAVLDDDVRPAGLLEQSGNVTR